MASIVEHYSGLIKKILSSHQEKTAFAFSFMFGIMEQAEVIEDEETSNDVQDFMLTILTSDTKGIEAYIKKHPKEKIARLTEMFLFAVSYTLATAIRGMAKREGTETLLLTLESIKNNASEPVEYENFKPTVIKYDLPDFDKNIAPIYLMSALLFGYNGDTEKQKMINKIHPVGYEGLLELSTKELSILNEQLLSLQFAFSVVILKTCVGEPVDNNFVVNISKVIETVNDAYSVFKN